MTVDSDVLERFYQEHLEEKLIAYLAEKKHLSKEQAMDIYYQSKLADQIHRGVNGIQYLDYRTLTQILCETEPELF